MAQALKIKENYEKKVHEELYRNIYMLTLIYPPTKEFEEAFKKDMFVKNNKVGFQQVTYYLLQILDPETLKKKIQTWPLLDTRNEIEFRNEVLKYINQLNNIYEYANIPQLMASHLISPGGFKFVRFMFSLSQLVVFEHIRCNIDSRSKLMYPLKPSKQTQVTSENLEKLSLITNHMEEETSKRKTKFENHFIRAKFEAENINEDQLNVNQSIKEKQAVLKELKNELERSDSTYVNNPAGVIEEAEDKLNKLLTLREKFKRCELLNSYLSGRLSELNIKELKIPTKIAHIVRFEGQNLDLSSFLEGFNTLIDRKRLDLCLLTDLEVEGQISRFTELNIRLSLLDKDLNEVNDELLKIKQKLDEEQDEIVIKQQSLCDLLSSNSTPLAVPLSPSPPSSEMKFNF